MKKSELRQIIREELLKERGEHLSKGMKYKELESMVQETIDSNDYKTFNEIIKDLWNEDLDNLFFRLFVNYDHQGQKLSKAMFKAMK